MGFSGATYGAAKSNTKIEIEKARFSPMTEMGTWDAATNTPTLTHGTGTSNHWYTCRVAGIQFGESFKIGDVVKYDGTTNMWVKIAYTSSIKGDKGEKGDKGDKGDAGEIVSVNATIDNKVGIPAIEVVNGGTPSERTVTINFKNMKGQAGEQGENAVTALNARGDYDVNAYPTYTKSDYITGNDGNSYVCKKDNPNNVAPTTGRQDDEYWQLMALKGAKGEKGDAGGISDDESAKLRQMNESKYNIDKAELFNLNDNESHLVYDGSLKTPKNVISNDDYELLTLPSNDNIVFPEKMTVETISPQGTRINLEQKAKYYNPTSPDYIDKDLIENKVFQITSWKLIRVSNGQGGYQPTYDSQGNVVLAAEETENITLSYGETKTIYVTDMSGIDKGIIDNTAHTKYGDGKGLSLYNSQGDEIYKASISFKPLSKVKPVQVSINKEYIYRCLLLAAGCQVDENGIYSDFGLVFDNNFNFSGIPQSSVGTVDYSSIQPTERNITEINDGGLPKCKWGFQGAVNVVNINYQAESKSITGTTQKIEPVYQLTSDVAVIIGKDYYTRTGSEGSYVYAKVESPVATKYELTEDVTIDLNKTYYTRQGEEGSYIYTEVETPDVADIASYYELINVISTYYELVSPSMYKLWVNGFNAIDKVFISQIF